MFQQVKVTNEYRNFLRFLCWPDGETSQVVQTCKIEVHLFGATSAPGCLSFVLKGTAGDNERRPQIYTEAVNLMKQANEMCRPGGFNLCKFLSNKREILQEILEQARADAVKDVHLDALPIERTLGVKRCIETDNFEFRVIQQDRPLTRRGILATICSIYDQFGFVAPIISIGKRIQQYLCRDRIERDEEILEEL